jgi:Flp pilus assembly protein TadG
MMKRSRNFRKDDSGTVAVVFALGLIAFFGLAALALDIGHMVSMKNQLQRAADAGAKAGARALWPYNLPLPAGTQPDPGTGKSVALATTTDSSNSVNGVTLSSSKVSVQAGTWNFSTRSFTPGGPNIYAVKVVTQSTATMFLAQVLGTNFTNLSATSIAVMAPAAMQKPPLPVAINQSMVVPGQQLFIDFYTTGNGGWFTIPPASASSSVLCSYIDSNSTVMPNLSVGDTINLSNGQNATVLQDIQSHLAQYNNGQYWDTFLPVVNTDTFNQSQPITGFVPFRVTQVNTTTSNKGVIGTVLGLDETGTGEPGDNTNNFGLLAAVKIVN